MVEEIQEVAAKLRSRKFCGTCGLDAAIDGSAVGENFLAVADVGTPRVSRAKLKPMGQSLIPR